ncbi:Golgi apparatus membrane protein tvp18 [Coemansia javaensis]|uniref:Golgi apparatus membrane protein tvp18 n=1 Tax=Coemansia javaensis TaxID=2761396 RepID=A0A9W8LJ86_9FUNG|nr:Golgi apparatus membrane protein tvp18 [Coemansia javaensis]
MGVVEELKTGNFSLYGQLAALLSGVLMIVLGAVTLLSHVAYSVLSIVFGVVALFIEIPLFLKLCPTGPRFDSAIHAMRSHWLRCVVYLVFAAVLWSALSKSVTILVIAAATTTVAAACYLVAAVRKQAQLTTRMLGGTGVAQPGANTTAYNYAYAQPV